MIARLVSSPLIIVSIQYTNVVIATKNKRKFGYKFILIFIDFDFNNKHFGIINSYQLGTANVQSNLISYKTSLMTNI